MKKILVVLLGALSIGCASSKPYLAKVNAETITGDDLRQEFKKRHGGHEKFLKGDVEARKFLDAVVNRKLLIQEAYRIGLQDQEEIRKDTADFESRTALEYFLRTELEEKSTPTPAEVKAVWDLKTSELRQLRHLVVETRAEADALYVQLLSGADFDALARECSLSQSRMYGGRLPAVGWGALDPSVESVAFALSVGETAPPVKTPGGWEIVRLEEIDVVFQPEFAKAAPRLEGILKRRKMDERKRFLSESLFSRYHVVLSAVDLAPAALRARLESAPDSPLANWDGGRLLIKDFATREELGALTSLPPDRARGHVEELLRQTVNEALIRLEVVSLKLGDAPAVAEPVRRHREDLMEGALYGDYILKEVDVTAPEVRAWYDQHTEDWISPEKRRVAHIVTATLEEAVEIRKRLAAGESFGDLARAKSKDAQTSKSGGDLGWITRKDVPPEFAPVLTLKEGETTEPVKTKFGYHVIKVVQIAAPRQQPFEAVKDEATRKLKLKKRDDKRALWLGKLRAVATIDVNEGQLKAFARENSIN